MNEKNKDHRLNELEIEKKSLEIEKIKKENEKTSLEIIEYNKSFFKKTNWWTVSIPLMFTIIPVIYLLLSGIFDSKYQEYKANKANLELDQKVFSLAQDSMQSKISNYQDSLRKVFGLISNTNTLLSKKQDSLLRINTSFRILKNQIKESEETIYNLNNQIGNKSKIVSELLNEKQNIERKMNDTINILNSTIHDQKFQISLKNEGKINSEKTIYYLQSSLSIQRSNCEQALKLKDIIIERKESDFRKLLEENQKLIKESKKSQ